AFILRGDRVLVERRDADDEHSPGAYRFPAGHVEPGETLEAALRREVREELDREVAAARPMGRLQFTGADGVHRTLHYFLTQLDADPDENPRLAWFSRDDRHRMEYPGDRDFIEELL
ncbi:MAG TPA: NUDIX domain-containing protein, partial [Elusimicrobiota bacterium]|nr:NUDIX domain-containing protein [Elusimicrobiota bacterium]